MNAPMAAPANTPAELQTLRELPLPPPVSYSPQTAGWAFVLAVLIVVALAGAWFAWRRYRRQRYRRRALAEVARIAERMTDTAQRAAALADIAGVLKRTALAAWPRERVAALSGEAWLTFLQHTYAFDEPSGALLWLASYGPAQQRAALNDADAQRLIDAARAWIVHHHVEV